MHQYYPRTPDNGKCVSCNFSEKQHSSEAECDTCGSIGQHDMHLLGGKSAVMCSECWDKEKAHRAMNTHEVKTLVDNVKFGRRAEDVILTRQDYYNAGTESVNDIRNRVNDDTNITNKDFEIARQLKEHFITLQKRLFSLKEEESKVVNEQRAVQQSLNHLANKITVEERERLQLKNLEYKPAEVAKPPKPKVAKPKKLDMKEVKVKAAELGVDLHTLYGFAIQCGNDLDKAVNTLRASIEQAKAISNQ